MTSAPVIDATRRARSSFRSMMAIGPKPKCRSRMAAKPPMGPAPAINIGVSRGGSSRRMTRSATPNGSAKAATWSGTPAGTRSSRPAGKTMVSANAPSQTSPT